MSITKTDGKYSANVLGWANTDGDEPLNSINV